MDVKIELAVLLGLAVVGQATFAVFEIETLAWRKILKWAMVIGVTLAFVSQGTGRSLCRSSAGWSASSATPCGVGGIGSIRSEAHRDADTMNCAAGHGAIDAGGMHGPGS